MKKTLLLISIMLLVTITTNAQTWHELDSITGSKYMSGDFKSAIEWGKKALSQAEIEFGKNDSNYAVSLMDLGLFYIETGNYKKAEQYLYLALDVLSKASVVSSQNLSGCQFYLGTLYFNIGDYPKAETFTRLSLELEKQNSGGMPPDNPEKINLLANIYSEIGDYDKAEPLCIQAIEIAKKTLGENHNHYAIIIGNLGTLYFRMGNIQKAETFLKQAIELYRKNSQEYRPEMAQILNNLSKVYYETGEYSKVESLLLESLNIMRKSYGENHPEYANSMTNLASLYIKIGDFAKAEPLLQQALLILSKSLDEKHWKCYSALNYLAVLYSKTDNYSKSELIYDSVHHILQSNISRNYAILSEYEKEKYNNTVFGYFNQYCGFVYKNYRRVPASVIHGFNNKLATNSLLIKSDVAMKNAIKTSKDSVLQYKYAEWIELKKQIATANNQSIATRKKNGNDLDSLEESANAIEKELVKKSAAFAAQNRKVINYTQVKKSLNNDEAAIEFASFKYKTDRNETDSFVYVVYIVKKGDTVPVYIPLFEQKELQLLLSSVGVAGRGATIASNIVEENENLYKEIYNLVWKKIEPNLKSIKTIYISPSGSLNKISFESLQNEVGVSLINRYQIHHLVSSGDLIALRANKKPIINKNIALFGGAVFDLNAKALQQLANKDNKTNATEEFYASRGVPRDGATLQPWTYLPGTLVEVKTISTTLKENKWNVLLDTGITATEEQLKALSGNSPEILHIATHGFYLPARKDTGNNKTKDEINTYNFAQNPMLRSGIILTGANTKWVEDKDIPNTENGVVTALDISNLDFTKTSLVVLSACQTGLGDVQSREGVYGLQRAFLLAGVKNALISLWSVPDKETAQMMELFYANLASGKTSYYEAFGKAQKTMQKQYAKEPLLWAGFELVGE